MCLPESSFPAHSAEVLSFWTWQGRRHHHGCWQSPQQGPKDWVQGALNQDIYLRLLVKLSRFHPVFTVWVGTNPPAGPCPGWKMKLPGQEEESAVAVGVVMDDVRTLEVPKSKVCALQASSQIKVAFSRLRVRASPPRAVAPRYCLVFRRAEGCTGLLSKPQEPHTARPNPMFTPRADVWMFPYKNLPWILLFFKEKALDNEKNAIRK